jgi:hypothetical protein
MVLVDDSSDTGGRHRSTCVLRPPRPRRQRRLERRITGAIRALGRSKWSTLPAKPRSWRGFWLLVLSKKMTECSVPRHVGRTLHTVFYRRAVHFVTGHVQSGLSRPEII